MSQRPAGLPPRPPSPRRGASAAAGRAAGLLAALLATSVGVGVLAAGVLVPGVAAAGSAAQGTVDLFTGLPADMQEQPLSQQSRILFADGSLMATFYYQNRVVVGLDRMAPAMRDAIIAIEDSRFYDHGGVDPEGMSRAVVVNAVRGGTSQGASTLTQQWVKNVLIEKAVSQLPADATVQDRQRAALAATESEGTAGYARKLREVKLAIAAEEDLTKDQILERYLNIADFGDGQYGVETAARHYFNKSAADLSVVDSALLAGIVQRPGAYNPVKNPNDSTARRNVVLARMLELGKIDQATHDAAVATPLEAQLDVQPTPNGCSTAGGSGYFCDFAVRNLLADPVFDPDPEQRRLKLYRGGLTITTTLDPAKQRAAEEVVGARIPNDASGVAASVVSVEPGTGRVVAMAQNRTYSTRADAGPGETSINYNVDRQSGGSRGWQPGSNAKPVVLATWLAAGNTLNQTVNATEKAFANNSWRYGACVAPGTRFTGAPYAPGNAGDGKGNSSMSVIDASYNSVNTAYVQMTNQLQLCDIRATATALGIRKALTGEELTAEPSMGLGTQEVAPLAVANAFATFAAQGTYCRPLAIAGVTGSDGAAVPVTGSSCSQVLSPDVANGVTYALKETLVRGTAKGRQLDGRVAAGKTGTTQNSWATWFTGYTPNLSTSVWIGYPNESRSLNGVTIAGRRHGIMYGGTVAAPTWQEYMNRALAGAPAPGFVDPPRSIIGAAPAPSPTARPKPSSSPRSSASSDEPAPPSAPEPAPEDPAPTQASQEVDEGDGGRDDDRDDDRGDDGGDDGGDDRDDEDRGDDDRDDDDRGDDDRGGDDRDDRDDDDRG